MRIDGCTDVMVSVAVPGADAGGDGGEALVAVWKSSLDVRSRRRGASVALRSQGFWSPSHAGGWWVRTYPPG